MAQVPDSLTAEEAFLMDTTSQVEAPPASSLESNKKSKFGLFRFLTKDYPNPLKAALFSLVIPSSGQIYNKKFWKVPIVATAVGTTVFLIGRNTRNYRIWREAYRLRVDGDETTIDDFVNDYPSADRLQTIRDGYRKRMEQSYIALVAVLLLNAADAFVDAHLLRFDVNDDLSLDLGPNFSPVGQAGISAGLGVRLSLK